MSQNKKVKLLGDADKTAGQKRPAAKSTTTTANPNQPVFAQIPTHAAPSNANSPSRLGLKLGLAVFVVVLTLLIVFPKPMVLHYQKDGIATQSVYWSGFMHYPALLLDSDLSPAIDDDRQELTLCDGRVIKDGHPTCSLYHIEKTEGLFAAWRLYRQTH